MKEFDAAGLPRGESAASEPGVLLELRGVEKSFFGTKVLTNANFSVCTGEVHALMGENGAGKSTLMKIIMGIESADSGEVIFRGEPVSIKGPREALAMGIAMIHQELNPVQEMSVAENIFLGREARFRSTPFVDRKTLNSSTAALLKEYNFNKKITPRTKMKNLSIAQAQMIEIIKAVSYNACLIIMDEPTSSLSETETVELFRAMAKLKKENVSIIYISHRMEEVMQLADRVTVLRDGVMAGTLSRGEIESGKVIKMMVGRELSQVYPINDAPKGEVVLRVENFSRAGYFKNINFEVCQGEILGLAGLVGAGRSEVARSIVGYDPHDSGSIYLDNKKIEINHPSDANDYHISLASEDRKALGLVLCRSIKENISLHTKNSALYTHAGFIDHSAEKVYCTEMAYEVTVKMNSVQDIVQNLSGGNQQKVVLARCLLSKPKVLILDEPTRGIDVGAKWTIYKMMIDLANTGIAIIMISSEMPELIGMSDRIIVMSAGEVRGNSTARGELTQEDILKRALEGV